MEDDENISTLLAMGFPDIAEIKRALRLSKNDLNEAVAVLTNESGQHSGADVFGPSPRPASAGADNAASQNDVDMNDDGHFPVATFYELETRVFQDNWSIPYKADEPLGKCLVAATKLAKEGKDSQTHKATAEQSF